MDAAQEDVIFADFVHLPFHVGGCRVPVERDRLNSVEEFLSQL